MNYQMLLLAHGAFYKYERRAKHYDTFMNTKIEELWNTPKPPMTEIRKLFKFIRRWDHHFRGDEELFLNAHEDNFDEIQYLKEMNFYDIDILERNNHVCIQNIINAFATCNNVGRYESTDASKMAHVINPDVFIMWDRQIREGLLGNGNFNLAENYVMNFLPKMKQELQDLIKSSKGDASISDEEIISLLENICGGKKITKLLDQYNYMSFTMPTEFNTYINEVKQNAPKEIWGKNFIDGSVFWEEQVSGGTHTSEWRNRQFVNLLNMLQNKQIITPEQRREYFENWRQGTDEDKRWFFKELEELARQHSIKY